MVRLSAAYRRRPRVRLVRRLVAHLAHSNDHKCEYHGCRLPRVVLFEHTTKENVFRNQRIAKDYETHGGRSVLTMIARDANSDVVGVASWRQICVDFLRQKPETARRRHWPPWNMTQKRETEERGYDCGTNEFELASQHTGDVIF